MQLQQGSYRSWDESLCAINGGIIAPGTSCIATDQGVFHRECAPPHSTVQAFVPRAKRVSMRAPVQVRWNAGSGISL